MADLSKIKVGGVVYTLKDAAVRSRVDTIESTLSSALVFKGVASSATAITGLTDYKTGWCYKASASFTITNVGTVESGDMIICIGDYNSALGWSSLDWTVVQNNVDVFSGATASAAGTKGLVPSPDSGKQDAILKGNGSWALPFVSSTRLSVAATADGANGYIPVYLDTNGNLCIAITGWRAISSLV